eukprot:4177519-Prymnesium_polylepis.1
MKDEDEDDGCEKPPVPVPPSEVYLGLEVAVAGGRSGGARMVQRPCGVARRERDIRSIGKLGMGAAMVLQRACGRRSFLRPARPATQQPTTPRPPAMAAYSAKL